MVKNGVNWSISSELTSFVTIFVQNLFTNLKIDLINLIIFFGSSWKFVTLLFLKSSEA